MPYCDVCGAEIAGIDAFCPNCGARITGKEEPARASIEGHPVPRTTPPSRRERNALKTAAVAVLILAVILIAGGASYYMFSLGAPGTSSLSSTTSQTSTSAAPTKSVSSVSTTSTTTPSTSAQSSATTTSTCNSATSTAATDFTPYLTLFSKFRSMSIQYSSSSGGNTLNSSVSYTVLYSSTSAYKINVTLSTAGFSFPTTAWLGKNGTVIAVFSNGQNSTGEPAANQLSGQVGIFAVELPSTIQVYTQSAHFHMTGTGTTSISGVSISLTNYAANSLPETFSDCGNTYTFDTYSLQTGVVAAKSYTLLIAAHIAGTFQGSSVDLTVRLTSLALA